MLDKKIILNDDSLYIEKNEGIINYVQSNKELSIEETLESFEKASIDLISYTNKFKDEIHLKRSETNTLLEWIQSDLTDKDSKISLLVGNAGMGKSVILKDLIDLLNEQNIPVLGIKVDKILNAYTIKEIETELFLEQGIIPIFENLLKNNKKCVLIIDQIDALSQSLSTKRNALTTYDRLIKHLKKFSNIRIVISTRTYDLNHDPIIKNYKNNTSLVTVSLLKIDQVNYVLSNLKISIPQNNLQFLEFLRTPLHLNIFCSIGWSKNFEKTINLQFLYDEIWNKFIETDSLKYDIEPEKIITALQFIADSMNRRQQIVVDKRQLDPHSKEVNYLLQHNLLVSNNNKIQFIHQTLFDYTYARIFLITQKDIKEWITNQHQGLFIRSQVRQLFSYLRNLDHNEYIRELRYFLNENNYRFHLKMLLISDLAFYHDPSLLEKKVVRDIVLQNPTFLEVFIESIQEIGWFSFLEDTSEFQNLLNSHSDVKKNNLVINLCTKILLKEPNHIIDFLSNNITNINLVQFVLIRIQEKDVHLSFDLYRKTKHLWDIHLKQEYYLLEKALNDHPDFVIQELKEELTTHLQLEHTDYSSDNYMPNGYAVQNIYEKLYETHPITTIPFFIEVLQLITNKNSYYYDNKNLKFDLVFYLFRPEEETDYLHQKIYNHVINFINKAKGTELDYLYIELLKSDIANLVAIGVLFLIKNKERYTENIVTLFTTSHFFKEYDTTEILKYYTHELLKMSYPILNKNEQSNIIDAILRTQKEFYFGHSENFYSKKKVYTYYLEKTYTLLNFLPYETVKSNLLTKKIYQEGSRKYNIITNKKPQRIQVKSGYQSYKAAVYLKMSLNDLKKSFYKLNNSQRSFDNWDKPEIEGHKNKFKELVKEYPEKYTPFIYELISDELVNISYIFVAIEALQEINYEFQYIDKVIKTLIEQRIRIDEYEDEYKFINLLRIIQTHIYTESDKHLDIEIFNLIKTIALNFPDKQTVIKDLNQKYNKPIDIVTTGINSARGIAVQCLISCYKMSDFSDQIFETLNSVSENANEVTRSCIIYQAACLNHLDIQKAYELYLKTVGDFNPLLLGIPFHNGHPLFYLMNYNFSGLKEIFENAIEIEITGEVFSNFLINAYMNNKKGSYKLLLKLLDRNKKARSNTIHIIVKECLRSSNYSSKGWKLIQYLLKYDDKENAENYNNLFLKLKVKYCPEVVTFIDNYLMSSVSIYKNDYFFKYIRDLISEDPERCLNWILVSNPIILPERYYDNTALNILIESYNGIREYDKENISLEKAMDMFDNLLQIPEYRNGSLNKFLKELES
ncbi:MAG: ATP-binding protein [Flavobacteriaceae bacterium]|jgi:SpoVK/Ycf46/Vps4 family AAA+-type ATPase|nr:ATP-binding protein [Flavobacteriaceae bacterium]